MLKNLIGEMAKRNVTMNDLAVLLGMHRNSIANKVYGKTSFSLDEAFAIFDQYFYDLNFRWLFTVYKV